MHPLAEAMDIWAMGKDSDEKDDRKRCCRCEAIITYGRSKYCIECKDYTMQMRTQYGRISRGLGKQCDPLQNPELRARQVR